MQPSAHLIDYERRFGGVARLYGREGAEAIAKTHFCVVGAGGIGRSFGESVGLAQAIANGRKQRIARNAAEVARADLGRIDASASRAGRHNELL